MSGEIDGYEFEGPTRYDKLFTGPTVEMPTGAVDRAGTEDITAEDTFDGDYGRLLEQFCVKGLASPRGYEEGRQWRPATFVVGGAA